MFSEIMSCLCAGAASSCDVKGTILADELPLCCCRMETPSSGKSLSTLNQTCMAVESKGGMVKNLRKKKQPEL